MASDLDFDIPTAGKWKDLRILEDGEEGLEHSTYDPFLCEES